MDRDRSRDKLYPVERYKQKDLASFGPGGTLYRKMDGACGVEEPCKVEPSGAGEPQREIVENTEGFHGDLANRSGPRHLGGGLPGRPGGSRAHREQHPLVDQSLSHSLRPQKVIVCHCEDLERVISTQLRPSNLPKVRQKDASVINSL